MLAQWRLVEEFHEVPFVQWNVRVIAAWMEAGLGEGVGLGMWGETPTHPLGPRDKGY